MKLMKYVVVLTIALCAMASVSNAQTVQFLGGGSSALALELGQAAQSSGSTATPCVWTHGKASTIVARDSRTGSNIDEQGNIWITWSAGSTGTCAAPSGTGINVYSYMSLDSVVGDKCFFEVESGGAPGCTQVLTIAALTAGANQLGAGFGPDTPIPAVIISALNNQHFFVAGTDIRPEDAKFASLRMFTACGAPLFRQPFDQGLRQTSGLGYQTGTTGVGVALQSSFSGSIFNVLDFNITGNDPITSQPVRNFTVLAVGAQPMIIAVSPAGGTGIGAASDINGFTLTLFQQGVLGRATDLFGPTTADPITTLIREPLSGTYNVMEYSVPNTSQFHASQDGDNCSGSTFFANPMTLQSTNGKILAFRKRVIGTGEMVAQLQAATPADQRLGYFFWSAGNGANFTAANGKYLTVNGVDPLLDSYTENNTSCTFPTLCPNNGLLPTTGNGNFPLITFKGLNQGDYPIWSALRLVSTSPTPAGVTTLIAGAQTLNSAQHDFVTLANLKVWHSHYYLPIINSVVSANGNTISTANDLCPAAGALGEFGGDAGGANVTKQANVDFCTDFGNQNGLINKAN